MSVAHWGGGGGKCINLTVNWSSFDFSRNLNMRIKHEFACKKRLSVLRQMLKKRVTYLVVI